MIQKYPSQLLENAVNAFASLPGIGRKSALRMALHILRQGQNNANKFITAISEMSEQIQYCEECHNISDKPTCDICSDPKRDKSTICVVESIKEVILALSPNMEGDTTCFYIYRKLAHLPVSITTIARGVAIGDDLEYADEITLGRSILNRIKYNKN